MDMILRVGLILGTVVTYIYMWRKVYKSQVQIKEIISWLFIGLGLIVIAVFPEIITVITQLLGIQSDTNTVFLIMIFVLLVISFQQMLKISKLQSTIEKLAQKMAIMDNQIRNDSKEQ